MSERLRADILSTAEAGRHRAAWDDLGARALEPNVFHEAGFLLPAARHLAGRRPPSFIVVWSDDELVGVCAVRKPRVPGLAWRAFSHPQATSAFPLLDRGRAESALEALLGMLGGAPLLCAGLHSTGPTAKLFARHFQVATVETRSRANLWATSEPLRPSKEVRRQERRLSEAGELSVETCEGAAIPSGLRAFLALEAAGWKGRKGTAFASDPGLTAFATEVITGLGQAGQARIDLLRRGDEAIAAAVVLRRGTQAWFWKTAFDERLSRLSPGVQLVHRLTASLLAEPDLEFTDSCAVPGHSMIDRLWRDRSTVVDCVIAPRSASTTAFRTVSAIETGLARARIMAKARLSAWRTRRARSTPH